MKIEPLLKSDIASLPELQPEDWNDIVPAFKYHLSNSFSHGMKFCDGNKLVAVGVTIIHGPVAWLAQIIVHPDYRSKGIGYQLTNELLIIAEKFNCSTVLLLATPLGYPVYLKHGFVAEDTYSFYRSEKLWKDAIENPFLRPYSKVFRKQIQVLDLKAAGENRNFRLDEFLDDAVLFVESNVVKGYFLPRFGEGLVVASEKEAGLSLLKHRLQFKNEVVIPDLNLIASQFLIENNYSVFRTAVRMRKGNPIHPDLAMVYARISGQIG
ncbi:MAG: GNAT family N-acetyltransferase [Bacteroidetes bacterium]|nr:GNAT family N-acetyltransferase [Bacteroidota bacterium]